MSETATPHPDGAAAPPDPTPPPDPTLHLGPPDPTMHPDPTRPPGPPPFWAYTPPPVAPALPPARPRWHRTRRACVVLAVVGVLVVAAAAVVAVQSFRDARTPQAAVRAYFGALARGDAATALGSGAVPAGGRALVSADVLRAGLARAPIDDVRTGAVDRRGDAATVAVRYRLGGSSPQEVDDTVALVRADGRWTLRRSAVPVTFSVESAASWAAVTAPTPFAVPEDTQLVFPGAAPVFYRTPVLEVAPDARVVRLADDDTVRVTAQVTAEGRADVTRGVLAALTACVAGGSDVDPYCPQPAPGRAEGVILRAVPQSFTGELQATDRPDLQLAVGADSAGTVTVSGTAAASGDWQVLDYDNVAQDRSGATTIPFRASVSVGATGTVRWNRG